jgi:hypothetical protein
MAFTLLFDVLGRRILDCLVDLALQIVEEVIHIHLYSIVSAAARTVFVRASLI